MFYKGLFTIDINQKKNLTHLWKIMKQKYQKAIQNKRFFFKNDIIILVHIHHNTHTSAFPRLPALIALRTFAPSCFTHLMCFTCSPYLRALFVHLKFFLGLIWTPLKTLRFPRTIKGTTNCAAFMWVKKQPLNLS